MRLTDLNVERGAMSERTPGDIAALADAVIELGADAMAFSRIERTCCYHATGEADARHAAVLLAAVNAEHGSTSR